MDIYVGNLPVDVTKNELIEVFEQFGQITEVRLITGWSSSKSKRYAFIEMPSEDEARKAIEEMNEKEFKEHTLNVSEAKPRKARRRKRGGKRKNRGKKRRGVYGGEDRNGPIGMRRRRPGSK
jgi:RNA recognition motif-containing protein